MRKHVEESGATGAAAGRGRGGRFSAGRKREVVMRLLRGEDLESVSRAVGITAARASHWRAQFLAAGQAGLKSRAPDARDEDHRWLQVKIGELLMETELLYAKVDQLEAGGPLARRRSTRRGGDHLTNGDCTEADTAYAETGGDDAPSQHGCRIDGSRLTRALRAQPAKATRERRRRCRCEPETIWLAAADRGRLQKRDRRGAHAVCGCAATRLDVGAGEGDL